MGEVAGAEEADVDEEWVEVVEVAAAIEEAGPVGDGVGAFGVAVEEGAGEGAEEGGEGEFDLG